MNSIHKRGEIATIVTLGALIIIGVSAIITSTFLPKKNTSNTKAATETDLCSSDGVGPPSGDCTNTTPFCDQCTAKADDGCKKNGDGGEAQVWQCQDGKWVKLYGECNTRCGVYGPAIPTSTPIPLLSPGSMGICKKQDGSNGESCSDLSTCNVDGKCDSLVCCRQGAVKTGSDGYLAKCDYANGACSSGYQWNKNNSSLFCRDKNGNIGERCFSIDYCDLNGGCNSACCKTDDQCDNYTNNYSKCNVTNSFCQSGSSCNTKAAPTATPQPTLFPTPTTLTPTPTTIVDYAPECQIDVEFSNNRNFPGEITVKTVLVKENNNAGISGQGHFEIVENFGDYNTIHTCWDGDGNKAPPWECKYNITKSGQYYARLYVQSKREYLTNKCIKYFNIANLNDTSTFGTPAISPPILGGDKIKITADVKTNLINCNSGYKIKRTVLNWSSNRLSHQNVTNTTTFSTSFEAELDKNSLTYGFRPYTEIQDLKYADVYYTVWASSQRIVATADQKLAFEIDYTCP